MTWRHIAPLAGGSSTWSGHRVAKAKSLEVVRIVVQVRIEASMAYSDIVLEFLESCCMLLEHRKSLTSKLEGSWKAASGTAGFSWESILYNAVIFLESQKAILGHTLVLGDLVLNFSSLKTSCRENVAIGWLFARLCLCGQTLCKALKGSFSLPTAIRI